jgi:hypothetical protein
MDRRVNMIKVFDDGHRLAMVDFPVVALFKIGTKRSHHLQNYLVWFFTQNPKYAHVHSVHIVASPPKIWSVYHKHLRVCMIEPLSP